MQFTMSASSTLRGFEFETRDGRIAPLVALLRAGASPYARCQTASASASTLLYALAKDVAEQEKGLTPDVACALVACLGAEEDVTSPLTWISARDGSSSIEWGLFLREGPSPELVVWFNHGAWGYRFETYEVLSTALHRFAQLIEGKVTWLNFGSPTSRRSLIRKGQFYWQAPANQRLIPIDNLIFVSSTGLAIRLAGACGRAVVTIRPVEEQSVFRWVEDYAEGLHLMAGLLDGSISTEGFTAQDVSRVTLQGHFVVQSIFDAHDEWAAPALVFCTGMGQQAWLYTGEPDWRVTYAPGRSLNKTAVTFSKAPSDALRHLAQLLAGEFEMTDPLFNAESCS